MLQWAIPNFSIINSFTIIMQSYADESTIVLWHRWCLIKVSMKQVQNKIKLNQVYSHVSLGYRSISALASTGRSGHCHHLLLLFHPPSSSRLLFLFLRKNNECPNVHFWGVKCPSTSPPPVYQRQQVPYNRSAQPFWPNGHSVLFLVSSRAKDKIIVRNWK